MGNIPTKEGGGVGGGAGLPTVTGADVSPVHNNNQNPRTPQRVKSGRRQKPPDPWVPLKSPEPEALHDYEVANVSEFIGDSMREVDVEGNTVLLVKSNGEYHAMGNRCTHYNAPLAKGVLCEGKVRCPWHGACFDVRTGDIEDFPGLDSLPKFEAGVRNGKVYVKANKHLLQKKRRQKHMACGAADDENTYLIIGGGPAAVECTEVLRQEGFTGKVIMASKEKYLPYDRPKLSKALNVKAETIQLRDADFYSVYDIEVQLDKEAVEVDTVLDSVKFADGSSINYTKLFLATGATPRILSMIPGYDLDNVFTLRDIEDAKKIGESCKGKNVVIIGTSFIGVETGAALIDSAKSVTIIDMVEAPFQLALGNKVGTGVKKLLEEKGLKFHFRMSPEKLNGEGGKLKSVLLKDGTNLPADVCIFGVGVVPVTGWLKNSGLAMSERGFVLVDKQMRTSKDNIYAGGDIVQFPLFMMDDEKVNIQHWQMAHQHGRIAALNMTGKSENVKSVPFFWTVIFGKSLRYAGYGVGYNDIIIHGSVEDLKFVAYYTKGERVIAVASMNYDPVVVQAAARFASDRPILKTNVIDDPLGWTKE